MKITGKELKKMHLEFFKEKGHAIISSAPLIPENDPTVLFTTAGMHPLIPYLMGQPHPSGKRIANVQKCIRTQDIDEVGDTTHTTFFEMLGSWSLADYFKKEAIEWSWEFLTSRKWLGLDPGRLAVSCFEGDNNSPKDTEAHDVWKNVGVPEERIAYLPKSENWWGPAGETGPCGPDTEMFYWKLNDKPAPKKFDPENENWVEIWNDVFIEYNKTKEGKYEKIKQQCVDTGLGTERVTMILQGKETIFDTELFKPIFEQISKLSGQKPNNKNIVSFRVITDHMRASTFILGDEIGTVPSNVDQGYILRRFIRRSIRHGKLIGIENNFCGEIAKTIIGMYKDEYPLLEKKKKHILEELEKEEKKFRHTLENGLKEFKKFGKDGKIGGKEAFLLFQSYGFPLEMTVELAVENKMKVDEKGFDKEFKRHQELSRVGAEKKFKAGLADTTEQSKKYHTATHLLLAALQNVLGDKNIRQKGSNITADRLRFDFNFDRPLTDEEKKKIEDWVNKVISEDVTVTREEMPKEKAKNSGVAADFWDRYPEVVSVYSVGKYSREVCGGPHVETTKGMGHFRIKKEQSSAAGVRRIKAVLE